jgi:hypothetical protein
MSYLPDADPAALGGLRTREQMMALPQFSGWRSKRSWTRAESRGLPVIRCGRLRLYDPVAVNEWLRQQSNRQRFHNDPARRRGRSRNVPQMARRRGAATMSGDLLHLSGKGVRAVFDEQDQPRK